MWPLHADGYERLASFTKKIITNICIFLSTSQMVTKHIWTMFPHRSNNVHFMQCPFEDRCKVTSAAYTGLQNVPSPHGQSRMWGGQSVAAADLYAAVTLKQRWGFSLPYMKGRLLQLSKLLMGFGGEQDPLHAKTQLARAKCCSHCPCLSSHSVSLTIRWGCNLWRGGRVPKGLISNGMLGPPNRHHKVMYKKTDFFKAQNHKSNDIW